MKIILNKAEYDILIALLNFSNKEFKKKIGEEYMSFKELHKMNLKKDFNNYYIDNNIKYIKNLRDIVANYLQVANSFDENYNPTKIGISIENLIDKFFV